MSFAMHGLVQSVGHSDELIHEFARLQQGGVAMQLHREYSPGRRLKQREGNKQNSPPAQPTPTTHRTAKSIHAIPGIATVVSKKPTLAVEDKSWPFLNPNEWRCGSLARTSEFTVAALSRRTDACRSCTEIRFVGV